MKNYARAVLVGMCTLLIESAWPRVPRAALILALAGCLFACTTVETRSFNVKKDAQVASAQITAGADFGRYDSLLPEDAGKDSQTGDVLARAADSAQAPAFATAAGTETDWPSVERAAQRWARLFREFLDNNMAR